MNGLADAITTGTNRKTGEEDKAIKVVIVDIEPKAREGGKSAPPIESGKRGWWSKLMLETKPLW